MDARTNEQSATRGETGGWADLLRPRYGVTTAMLCIGIALYAFNGFLVSTSLPSAVAELGGASLMSWSLSLYLAASIVAGASAAMLKLNFGGRATLIGAALLFLAGTLVAASASSMQGILAGRLLQGVGEGVVAALCYALIPEMFPPRLVPKVFGAEASVWAIAAFGGPLAAGLLTEQFSWRAAFYFNVPIVALFVLLVALIVPKRPRRMPQEQEASSGDLSGRTRPPLIRLVLLSLGLAAVMVAAVVATPLSSAALIAVAAFVFLALVRRDRDRPDSILPSGAFSFSSVLGLGLWVVLMMPVAQATSSVFLVFGLQNLWGFTPTAAGALGALMAISWSLSAIAIAHLRDQTRQFATLWLGPLLQVAGLSCLFSGIVTGLIAPVVVGQVLTGTGFGISWAFLSQTLMRVTPEHERDKTSALLPTLQSAGYAIGGAFCGLAANVGGLAAAPTGEDVRVPLTIAFLFAILFAIPAGLGGWRATRSNLLIKAGL